MLDESRTALDSESSRQKQQPPMALAPSRVVMGGSNKPILEAGSSSSSVVPKKNNEQNIWQDDEIPTEDSIMSKVDGRPSPKYEFSYKQEVGTQDTFLGLNGKTPGSSDCSHLVSCRSNFLYF